MSARRLIYKCMMLAPLAFLAGMGIHSRTYSDSFHWKQTTADHVRLNAYIPLVRDAQSLMAIKDGRQRASQAREIANRWVNGYASGGLKHLHPIGLDDMEPDSAKGGAYLAGSRLARILSTSARQEWESGDKRQALKDMQLNLTLLRELKYSSFHTVHQIALFQRSDVATLETWYGAGTPDEQVQIRRIILDLRKSQQPLEEVARRERRLYAEASASRATQSASDEAPADWLFESRVFAKERDGRTREARNFIEEHRLEEPGLVLDARLGYESEATLRELTDAFLKKTSASR